LSNIKVTGFSDMKKQAWTVALAAGMVALSGCGSSASEQDSNVPDVSQNSAEQTDEPVNTAPEDESVALQFAGGTYREVGYCDGVICADTNQWKSLCDATTGTFPSGVAILTYGTLPMNVAGHFAENSGFHDFNTRWDESEKSCVINFKYAGQFEGTTYNGESRDGTVLAFEVYDQNGKRKVGVVQAI